LRSLGKTILVSSHILTELAEMCTHVAIIERGRLLVSGGVSDILQAMQPAREIYVRVLAQSAEAARIINQMPGVLAVRLLPPGYKRGQEGPGETMLSAPVAPEPSVGSNPAIPPPPGAVPPDGPATLYVRVNGDDLFLSAILSRVTQAGIPVFGFEEAVGDLEEIFLRTTKGLVQ